MLRPPRHSAADVVVDVVYGLFVESWVVGFDAGKDAVGGSSIRFCHHAAICAAVC